MANSHKAVEFMDAAPAGENSTRGYRSSNEVIMPGQMNGAHGYDDTPSYASILNGNASLPEKVKMLAVATKQKVDQQFSSIKPWTEFFDRTFFASPAGSSEAITRLNTNIRYFRANYILLSLVCSSYILLINLSFSICVLMAVGFYLYVRSCAQDLIARGDVSGQIYLFRRPFSASQLYLMLAVFAIVTFWLFNGGSVVFWLVLTSLGVSCGHAIMRRPPLTNDDFSLA